MRVVEAALTDAWVVLDGLASGPKPPHVVWGEAWRLLTAAGHRARAEAAVGRRRDSQSLSRSWTAVRRAVVERLFVQEGAFVVGLRDPRAWGDA